MAAAAADDDDDAADDDGGDAYDSEQQAAAKKAEATAKAEGLTILPGKGNNPYPKGVRRQRSAKSKEKSYLARGGSPQQNLGTFSTAEEAGLAVARADAARQSKT